MLSSFRPLLVMEFGDHHSMYTTRADDLTTMAHAQLTCSVNTTQAAPAIRHECIQNDITLSDESLGYVAGSVHRIVFVSFVFSSTYRLY